MKTVLAFNPINNDGLVNVQLPKRPEEDQQG